MIDKSEWKTKDPKMFEYDSKNQAVDIFVREDERCPFHEEDWYHEGFWIKDFILELKLFFERYNLQYEIIKK